MPVAPLASRVWIAVAAIAAAAIAVAAWQTGDWWAADGDEADRNLTVARLLVFACVFGLLSAAPRVWRRGSTAGRIAFAGWSAYLGAWLAGQWPGLVEPDTVEMMGYTRQAIVFDWYSYLHSVLNLAALDVVPHIWVFGVLQVAAMAGLLAYVTTMILAASRSPAPAIAFTVIAALSAPLVVYTLHYSRDTIFAILHVYLALVVGRAVVERRSLTPGALVGIALLTGFLSAYRGDGIALLVAVPALLLLLRPPRRVVLRAGAVFVAATLLFHVALPAALTIQTRPHLYGLTLRMNPLGAVLKNEFLSADPERDLSELGRVIDVARVRQLQTPVNIPAYWAGAWRGDASEADWAAFERASNRLFVNNLPVVIANRIVTFGASSGLAPGAYRGPEYIMDDPADRVVTLGQDPALNPALTAAPPWRWLYTAQENLIHRTAEFNGILLSGSALHWNLLPWLGILVVALAAFRRLPLEAAIALVVLSRFPLIFAVAPIAQFKYYNSVHLGGLVVLGLMLPRLFSAVRRRTSTAAGP